MKKNNLYSTSKKYKQQDIIDARKWFREKIINLQKGGKVTGNIQYLRYRGKAPVDILGSMVFYRYDPKTKDTLPYWDTFPLVIVIGLYDDGFLGLNLHYLPPKMRANFLGKLFDTINNTKFDKSTKLKVTYSLLKGASKYKYFQPCLKRYLYSHTKTKVNIVRPEQWHKAILLPVAKFKGASQSKVWADSKAKWR